MTVVNRTDERGRSAAEAYGAVPRPFSELVDAIRQADIVISSTTSPGIVIDRAAVDEATRERDAKDLLIVDIAVPRDVEPAVNDLPDVVVHDIDDLRTVVDASVGSRLNEVSKVEAIVAEEVTRFLEWERASEIGPTVAALVQRAEEIRAAEVARMRSRLQLDDADFDVIDQATRRMVAKLLHPPLTRAKELSDSKQGHSYLAALRELFELDDDLPS